MKYMDEVDVNKFLQACRTVSAQLTFTDYRLRFADMGGADDPSAYDAFDSSEYGTGILQVAHFSADPTTTLKFRYISNMDGTWPGWNSLTVASAIKSLGLYGATLFTTGGVYTFDGSTFGSYSAQSDLTTSDLLAPVSATEVYLLRSAPSNGLDYRKIVYKKLTQSIIEYPGRVFEESSTVRFDAVRVGDMDRIYVTKNSGRTTVCVSRAIANVNYGWGSADPLIPMDVVDDISQVELCSVNVINGKPMVAAVLVRSSGLSMHMYTIGNSSTLATSSDTYAPNAYTMGANSYTLGREMFITTSNPTGWGKLHLIGSKVWYAGPGVRMAAPATILVGYNNADLTFSTSEISSINMPLTKNDAPTTQVTLKSGVTHAALREGAICKLQVTSNGTSFYLGTFGVDAITYSQDDSSRGTMITMRSLGMKEVFSWESDAPFDYWSQTKVNTNPSDLTEVVRTSALWKQEANGLTTYDLNTKGFLYVAERSCINGIIEGRFTRSTGDTYSRFGVGLHYTVETPLDTATRLGMQEAYVTEDLVGHSGLFVIAGMKEHSGSEGLGLYVLNNNVWTQVAHWALTIGTTQYWLRLQYADGFIIIHTRAEGTAAWTEAGRLAESVSSFGAPASDLSSRGAIFMENATGGSTCPLMDDKITFIPVLDNSTFPTEDTVKIDEEFIHYTSKSGNNRKTFKENWRVACQGDGYSNGAVNNATFFTIPIGKDNTSTAVKIPVSGAYDGTKYGTSYFVKVAKIGNPTDSLYISGTNGSGTLQASITIKPEMIPAAPIGTLDPASFPTLLVFIKPHSMPYLNGSGGEFTPAFLTVRRSTQTTYDANNYYVVLGAAATIPGGTGPTLSNDKYWTTKYNTASSTWEKPYAGKCTFSLVQFCQDPDTSVTAAVTYPFVTNNSFCANINDASNGNVPSVVGLVSILPGDLIRTIKADDERSIDSFYRRIITMNESYGFHCTLASAGQTQINPSGLSTFNTVEAYPVLQGAIRGFNSTAIASHKNAKIDVWRTGPFAYIDALHYWSGDVDISLDQMIREIATKAGYPNVSSNPLIPWDYSPHVASPVVKSRNFVVKMIVPASYTAGTIVVEGRRTLGAEQVKIEITNTYLKYYSGATLKQQYNLPVQYIFGELTVSFYEEHVSVWLNGILLHVFVLDAADAVCTGEYMCISGTCTQHVWVYLPEGCARVDNYILDNNKTAISLIDALIGNKKFWFFDSNDTLKIVRSATEVSTPGPYALTVINNHSKSEMGAATRIRVEGAEICEVIDEEMMTEYGNLFHYINIPEINSVGDAEYYAAINLEEMGSSYEIYSLQGAADPRLEPQDVISVNLPEGTKRIVIDEVNFMIDIQSEGGPLFDMMINGRVLRSDL